MVRSRYETSRRLVKEAGMTDLLTDEKGVL